MLESGFISEINQNLALKAQGPAAEGPWQKRSGFPFPFLYIYSPRK